MTAPDPTPPDATQKAALRRLGDTLKAACELCERLRADIYEVAVVIELPPLNGRAKLTGYNVHSLIEFNVS